MLRTKQEIKHKYYLSLDRRMDELRWSVRDVEYIPLEKPEFMGWNMWITLSPQAMLRRDAPKLLTILDILGVSKKQFVRNPKFIRELRRNKYSIDGKYRFHPGSYYFTWQYNRADKKYYYHFPSINSQYITTENYSNLKLVYKALFYEDKYESEWSKRKIYRLNFRFPNYELTYKIEKAYATHRGIPYGEDISEYQRIRDILHDNHFYCAKNGGYSRRHWNWHYKNDAVPIRKHWKNLLTSMINKQDFEEDNFKSKLNNYRR